MRLNGPFSLWAPLALVFVLRLPDLFVPYYNIDELTNSLFANMILDGRLTLLDFLGNTYLLTHYFYAAVTALFGRYTLFPVYLVNLVWCMATAAMFYAAGKELTGRREGGFWAAIFYATASVCFMSKDYRAVIAEPLSLLPLAAAAFFYFRAVNKRERPVYFFLIGFLVGVGALFKAPAGVMIFALWSSFFFRPGGFRISPFLLSALGLGVAILFPVLLTGSPWEGIHQSIGSVQRTKNLYIGAYEDLPIVYWFFKYLFRTFLVALSCPLVWYAAFRTLGSGFYLKKASGPSLKKRFLIFFLFFWFLADWFVVTMGKRIFYHYFIFLIPSVCFLAVPTLLEWREKWSKRSEKFQKRAALFLGLAVLVPPAGYTVEAIAGWSTRRPDFTESVDYIRSSTGAKDRIYVWGMTPQVYFFSRREPATTFFWSDVLAGTSAGSPAMEYMRVTGKSLSLPESIIRDLKVSPAEKTGYPPVHDEYFYSVRESEFLSLEELLERIDNILWKKVFQDFFEMPPVLFIDTSPTGIRGFSHFPIEKYELLKKFIDDNYTFKTTVDDMLVYHLKERGSNAP